MGAFIGSAGGGRPKEGVARVMPNALGGGNYFRNLFPTLLERDVGPAEFDAWLSSEQITPALKLQHLEKWPNMAQV